MNFSSRTLHSILIFWAALALALLHRPVQAVDFTHCSMCHKVVLEEVFRPYLHVPFQQQRCGECHLPQKSAPADEVVDPVKLQDRRKINWLGESLMADRQHAFVLPAEKVRDSLLVETRGANGAFSRKELPLPPLASLAEVKDSGRPPVISDVGVLKVERGVFLSATVGWQTDALADAQVRYDSGDLTQSTPTASRLGRRHEIVLVNLKPDQTYRFTVVSRDIFGRSQESPPLTFSTAQPSAARLPDPTRPVPGDPAEIGFASQLLRLGGNYLLELNLEQPAAVSIGTGNSVRKPALATGLIPTGGNDRNHQDLSSKQAAGLAACGSCHRKMATATHPVNVFPKPGMVIPPEYPTLPDGRITCRSCHEAHSSDNEYLTIKPSGRTLCVGCHKDML